MFRFFIFLFFSACFLSCQSEIQFASVSEIELPAVKMESLEEASKPSPKLKEHIITLTAKKTRALDVLIVLDTTASMDHHLGKLGGGILPLLDSISDYDWQIGFTTADHGDHAIVKITNRDKISSIAEDQWKDHSNNLSSSFGKLMPLEALPLQISRNSWELTVLDQKILTAKTPDYKDIFFNTVSHFPIKNCEQPPFCQKDLEQPLRSLKSAMERVNWDNKELFRPHADFVSFIIANEEERQEDPNRATTAQEVVDTFNRLLKPLGKRFFAFNLLVLDKKCQESEKKRGGIKSATANLGVEIGKLAELTGGENISICLENYNPSLQKISQVIKTFVEQSFDIEKSFVPETLKVEFIDEEPIPWELSGHRLIFKEAPSENKEVKVSYSYLESL